MSHIASYRKSTWKMWLLISLFALSTLTAYKPVAAMSSQANMQVVLIAGNFLPISATSSHDSPQEAASTLAFTHAMPTGDISRSCLYMAWAVGLRPLKSHDSPQEAVFTHAMPPGDISRSCLYMAWAVGLRPSH
jgi:hypothetical protein